MTSDVIVKEYNEVLEKEDSIVRLYTHERSNKLVEIGFKQDVNMELDNHIVTVSDTLIEKLNNYLNEKGIKKVHYNNTRSSFWWN